MCVSEFDCETGDEQQETDAHQPFAESAHDVHVVPLKKPIIQFMGKNAGIVS